MQDFYKGNSAQALLPELNYLPEKRRDYDISDKVGKGGSDFLERGNNVKKAIDKEKFGWRCSSLRKTTIFLVCQKPQFLCILALG